MSMQSPLTLYELVKQNLMNSETIAGVALEDLPTLIFHDIFMDAFMREHDQVLRVMVQAWPFPCLPLRTLMALRKPKTQCPRPAEIMLQERNLQTLEALLSGLDKWLSQKVHHSRCKLQVLDWRDVHQDFWTRGPRAMRAACSTEARNPETGKPGSREKKPTLTILADLCFESWSVSRATDDNLLLCLLQWTSKRKASVHLLSERVTIKSTAIFKILKLLRAVHMDSIQELHVFSDWGRERMKAFVPHLKKMTNLRTFYFSELSPEVFTSPSKNKWYSRIYAFHLRQLQSLQEFHVDNVFFLHGTLHKIFRSQTPLEALSLSLSPLKESDLKHLSQCPSTSQLKALTLRHFSMKPFNPETLHVLLDKLAGTLHTLALEYCEITDSQLLAILPALSRCCHLKTFSCYGNPLSLGILQALLRLTAGLSQLTQGLFPAPLESYKSKIPTTFVHPEQFPRVRAELARVLKDIRPSLRVQICTYSCEVCSICQFYRLEPSGNWDITEEYRNQGIKQLYRCVHNLPRDDTF